MRKAINYGFQLDILLVGPLRAGEEWQDRVKKIVKILPEARKIYKELEDLYNSTKDEELKEFIRGKLEYLEFQIKNAEAILSSSGADKEAE